MRISRQVLEKENNVGRLSTIVKIVWSWYMNRQFERTERKAQILEGIQYMIKA